MAPRVLAQVDRERVSPQLAGGGRWPGGVAHSGLSRPEAAAAKAVAALQRRPAAGAGLELPDRESLARLGKGHAGRADPATSLEGRLLQGDALSGALRVQVEPPAAQCEREHSRALVRERSAGCAAAAGSAALVRKELEHLADAPGARVRRGNCTCVDRLDGVLSRSIDG